MKFKICLILIFLFSLFSNSVRTYALLDDLYLENIQNEMKDDFEFQQNGVRSVYRVNAEKQDVIKNTKCTLEANFKEDVIEKNDEINIRTSLKDIQVKFFSNNNQTIVYFTIINYNKEIIISNLMKELTELQGKNIFDIRYFQYIKGKINNIDDRLKKIESLHQINNIDTLDIHNGYVGRANLNNGERVNIALNSYDTGNYLVIGTPVIFVTY
ncbi:MAG: hypothetical protein E7213_01670 [Clostridium sp.]|nr:hypothetical protein [Clostridium sp.]